MSGLSQTLASVWHADTLEGAKKLIYDPSAWSGKDGESWEQRTEDAIPVIMSSLVETLVNSRAAALEIGCGVGRLVKPMASLFRYSFGIDVSPSMVEFSKEYLAGVANANVRLCDGESIPFPDESISFVYSMIAFQHIPFRSMIRKYLREVRRVLVPGGVARIQTCRGAGLDILNGTQGYGYVSAMEFAKDFIEAGLWTEEVVAGLWHVEHLWVTARRPE